MKISEKQFLGTSYTFTFEYQGSIMEIGEDENEKKNFKVAGKEGLTITVNGVDVSSQVFIDDDKIQKV